MKSYKIAAMLSLLACISCGGSKGGGSDTQTPSTAGLTEASDGNYYSVLRPVNFQSNGYIPYGAANFKVQGDQLQVNVSLDDDQPVAHRQSMHIGTRCPTMNDDLNGDGFVDYDEALLVVGQVLIPLDDNLNSQMDGAHIYPRGRAMTYAKSASLGQMNNDLWKSDENLSDDMTKLPSGNRLGFEGRVVLVHGTANQSFFPASLASYEGEPAHLSLPVVCGVLKKVD